MVLVEREGEFGRQIGAGTGSYSVAPSSNCTPLSGVVPSSRSYMIYTSGSTGRPKGVVLHHRGWQNLLSHYIGSLDLRSDPIRSWLCVTTISFDIAMLELLAPLQTGMRITMASREDCMDAARLVALTHSSRPGVLQTTPTRWELLLDQGLTKPIIDHKITILTGGEPLAPKLQVRLQSVSDTVWNVYGPTETTIWSTDKRTMPGKDPTIGRPIANTVVYIVDEKVSPLPVGLAGELLIGGAGVASGYFNRPELTSDRFVDNHVVGAVGTDGSAGKLYRTGDLARWLPNGEIQYLGRIDFQVKLRGQRIELGEVEHALLRQGATAAAALVKDQTLVAFVALPAASGSESYPSDVSTTSPSPAINKQSLLEGLRAELPRYMVPSVVVVLQHGLPQTPNGKVDRKALARIDLTGEVGEQSNRGGKHMAPRTEAEQVVAAAFAEVLESNRPIDMYDDFFDIGGHSLLAMRLTSALRKGGHVSASVADVMAHRTIAGIASALDSDSAPLLPTDDDQVAPQAHPVPQGPKTILSNVSISDDTTENVTTRPMHPALFCALQILGTTCVALEGPMVLFGVWWGLVAWAERQLENVDISAAILRLCVAPAALLVSLLVHLVVVIHLKRLLVGQAGPGRYPIRSSFHLRWWIKNRLLSNLFTFTALHFIQGTWLMNRFYRRLGARVGKGAVLYYGVGEDMDLVTIGHGTRVEFSELSAHVYEAGHLVLRHVTIGDRCLVEHASVCSGATIENGAELRAGTVVPPRTRVKAHKVYHGRPVRPADGQQLRQPVIRRSGCTGVFLQLLAAYTVAMLHYVAFSAAATTTQLLAGAGASRAVRTILFIGVGWFPGALAVVILAVLLHCLLVGRFQAGTRRLDTLTAFRIWMSDLLLFAPMVRLAMGQLLNPYSTVHIVLRAFGIRTGDKAFVNLPAIRAGANLVSYGDRPMWGGGLWVQTFERIGQDVVFRPIHIGNDTVAGHGVHLAPGTRVEDRAVVGGMTATSPDAVLKEEHVYMGCPPQTFTTNNRSSTYADRRKLFRTSTESIMNLSTTDINNMDSRLKDRDRSTGLIKVLGIIMQFLLAPVMLMILLLPPIYGSMVIWERYSLLVGVLALPALWCGSVLCCAAFMILSKRAIVGRFAGDTAQWGLRTQMLTVIGVCWGALHTLALGYMQGTALYVQVVRLMGARVGRGVFFDTVAPIELDAIEIGDDAILDGCFLEAHSIDNGRISFGQITVGARSVIGRGCILTPLSKTGEGSTVLPGTYMMKGEEFPSGTVWVGNPAVRMPELEQDEEQAVNRSGVCEGEPVPMGNSRDVPVKKTHRTRPPGRSVVVPMPSGQNDHCDEQHAATERGGVAKSQGDADTNGQRGAAASNVELSPDEDVEAVGATKSTIPTNGNSLANDGSSHAPETANHEVDEIQPHKRPSIQTTDADRRTLTQKVSLIKGALGLEASLPTCKAIEEANAMMGLAADGNLMQQADALLGLVGV